MLPAIVVEPPPSTGPDDDLLRGPSVPDRSVRTLVRFDADGRFIALRERPEEAALGLMLLEPQRRERARDVAESRRISLGMLLVDNIDLVREGTDAIAAGERAKTRQIYRDLHTRFDPEGTRDPLLKPFADILSPAELDDLRRLVDEYWSAWIDWEMRDAADRTDEARKRIERRLAFTLFQQEVGEAYTWSLRPFRTRLETLYEITQPTPEQRAALREAVIDHIRESRLKPTPEQQRRVADRIYSILDEDQRRRLFEHLLWKP
jgi:hypothetical protein